MEKTSSFDIYCLHNQKLKAIFALNNYYKIGV